jgi:hypothetical protein
MLGTCPRCAKSRTLTQEGAALACPSCGYTDHVSSLPPPEGSFEPLWAPALMICVGVSSIVFAVALVAARVAAAGITP